MKRENTYIKTLAILSVFFTTMSTQAVIPGIQNILMAFPDESYVKVMLIVTLPSLASIPASLISGKIAGDKIGYKSIYLFGFFLFTVSGIAPFWLRNLNEIFLCRILFGLSIGILRPLGATLIFAHFEEKYRGMLMGWGVSVQSIGGIILTMLGGVLATKGWSCIFLSHLVGVPLFFLILFFLPSSPKVQNTPKEKQNTPKKAPLPPAVLLFTFLGFTFGTVIYPLSTNMSTIVMTDGLGDAATAALIVTIYTLGSVIGGSIYSVASSIFKRLTLFISFLLVAAGLFFTYIGHDFILLSIGSTLAGIGSGMYMPEIYMIIGEVCHASVRTMGMSLFMTSIHTGFFFSPTFYSILCSLSGTNPMRFPFIFGTFYFALVAAAFLIAPSMIRTNSKQKEG